MNIGNETRRMWSRAALFLAAFSVCLIAGCGDFWQAPSGGGSNSFTVTNNEAITIVSGSTSGTSTISVTPGSSFTGTVTLSCTVTTSPSGASVPLSCSLSQTSVSITSTTAQQSTLTASFSSTPTAGIYDITVNGDSGSIAESTVVCVAVGVSSSGCTSTAGASGNFYILNSTTISGYSLSGTNLTALAGSPTALPAGVKPRAMAINPSGTFLYVSTDAGIYLYDIGSGGALTLAQQPAVEGDTLAYAIKVDGTGTWLLDASGQGYLFAYPINSTTGIPSATNSPPSWPLAAGATVEQMAISVDNNLIAVAEGSGTQAFTFAARNTGTVSPFTTAYSIPGKGTVVSVAFSPETNFLYIGETGVFSSSTTNSGGLSIIPITSDVPGNEPSASPYPSGGTGPDAILATANGYVYAANVVGSGTATGDITAFLLNASASSLTQQSNPVATGPQPVGMVEDSSDTFVLVVNAGGNPEFDAYTFDATTAGQLDGPQTASTGTGPIAIVAVER